MNIPVQNCSSCAACANACARSAISMQLDAEGFYRPVIDVKKCVECGACERVCPWNKAVENPNVANILPKTVAAYAKDESIRLQSSSGGIFTVLAERVLDDGGVVVGVARIAPTRFGFIIVDNKVDLVKLRGSKYVQANVGLIYKKVRALLKVGRKVLFSGTPCQVAGLYAVLGKVSDSVDLVTVDIVCHGMPSVNVFEKYVREMEKTDNSVLDCINFRDKSEGWSGYALLHQFESGRSVAVPLNRSKYMHLFKSRICQNVSCGECRYRKLPRIADITLGDYWGISKYHPEMNDNKGTSVVLLNTSFGIELFDSVADKVVQCESKLEYAIAGNPCIVRSSKQHPKRAEFFANLDNYSLDELIKMYCPFPSAMARLHKQIRKILGRVKRKIKMFV
ncbi:Coenzyme F420 hydrogenase/dehydrogenase, beta subunit C-terminal domain [Fibrobacter sp.]|uniref:Coenzyme F420 hydrogenase/dehydrogenase, beta subunit C-terminal domain n=1 Tax=Fibrobacter sp. TaxID=35828 RepID=UPI0025C3511D|nr:Coenzyme F420 hydrogenase/dehydrogenase, beta subunit C-terminal domain [Fibrobacter sp.]MBR3071928.1 Coenzyme F420 hydrogenase/dehydrogenase, beta subunit C-terminal domain [Fibrobacter sp.]